MNDATLGYRLQSSYSAEPTDKDWLPLDIGRPLTRQEAIEACQELAAASTLRPSWRVVDAFDKYIVRISGAA